MKSNEVPKIEKDKSFGELVETQRPEFKFFQRKKNWIMAHRPKMEEFNEYDNAIYTKEALAEDTARVLKMEEEYGPEDPNWLDHNDRVKEIALFVEAYIIDRIKTDQIFGPRVHATPTTLFDDYVNHIDVAVEILQVETEEKHFVPPSPTNLEAQPKVFGLDVTMNPEKLNAKLVEARRRFLNSKPMARIKYHMNAYGVRKPVDVPALTIYIPGGYAKKMLTTWAQTEAARSFVNEEGREELGTTPHISPTMRVEQRCFRDQIMIQLFHMVRGASRTKINASFYKGIADRFASSVFSNKKEISEYIKNTIEPILDRTKESHQLAKVLVDMGDAMHQECEEILAREAEITK